MGVWIETTQQLNQLREVCRSTVRHLHDYPAVDLDDLVSEVVVRLKKAPKYDQRSNASIKTYWTRIARFAALDLARKEAHRREWNTKSAEGKTTTFIPTDESDTRELHPSPETDPNHALRLVLQAEYRKYRTWGALAFYVGCDVETVRHLASGRRKASLTMASKILCKLQHAIVIGRIGE